MSDVSTTIPEFVEKHVCLHSPLDAVMKKRMETDLSHLLWYAMEHAIDMYVELTTKHEEPPVVARAKACLEIAEGLNVESSG